VDGLDFAEHGTWGYPEFAEVGVPAVVDARRVPVAQWGRLSSLV
jgi:hypothetical protein